MAGMEYGIACKVQMHVNNVNQHIWKTCRDKLKGSQHMFSSTEMVTIQPSNKVQRFFNLRF
jgi:hypothetical protein